MDGRSISLMNLKTDQFVLYVMNLSVFIEYNIRRHYQTKRAFIFDRYQGQFRKENILRLKLNYDNQHEIFIKIDFKSKSSVKATYSS